MYLIALGRPYVPIKIYAVTFTRGFPLSNGLSPDLPQTLLTHARSANLGRRCRSVSCARLMERAVAVLIARDVPGDMLFTSGCSI